METTDRKSSRSAWSSGLSTGVKAGLGVLQAFVEAVQETLQETLARHDVNAEQARQRLREASQRLQATLDEWRERVDFVPRREFEQLQAEVAQLRQELQALRQARVGRSGDHAAGPPATEE